VTRSSVLKTGMMANAILIGKATWITTGVALSFHDHHLYELSIRRA